MEREGEGREMKRRGEGGGEMRKGIMIGGMVLGLLMGCNNGIAELEKKNQFLSSVVSLGNDFLNVFTSFGDMLGDVLGFNEKTTKSAVGAYFNKVKETVEGTKEKLEKIVADMEKENNPNAAAVKTKVDELIKNKLSHIIKGAETVSGAIGDSKEPLANVADSTVSGAGIQSEEASVNSLSEGIGKILDVVLKEKGNPEAGTIKKADDLGDRTYNVAAAEAGKLFATSAIGSSHEKKAAADAAKAVGAVTGADILQAIAKNGDSAKLAKETNGNTAGNAPKDGTIAGAVALRAMAKKGRFANKNASDGDASAAKKAVEDVALSAVTKALGTLTIAIRKTIDEGLNEVKGAMNINANDNPVTSETGVAAK